MSALTYRRTTPSGKKIEQDIVALGAISLDPPINVENATKYAYRLYHALLKRRPAGVARLLNRHRCRNQQLQRPDDLLLLKRVFVSKSIV